MSFFHRQLWKQKPQAWGPFSAVQYALRHHLEKLGILWEDVVLALPMWGPGTQYDYSKNKNVLNERYSYPAFVDDSIFFDGNDTIYTRNPTFPTIGTGPYSLILGIKLTAYGGGMFGLNFFNPTWANGPTGNIYIYDYTNKGASTDTLSLNINQQAAWVRESTSANKTHQYVNGDYSNSVTHSDSFEAVTSFTIGSDRPTAGIECTGYIQYVIFCSGVLSSTQIAQLHDNPYQIWQPVPRTRYFFVDSGSGTTDDLTNADLTCGTPTLDTPTIAQTHVLNGTDLTAGIPSVETPTIGQIHSLAGQDITLGTPILDTPTLAEGTDNLVVFDLTAGTPTLEAPIIGQVHVLDVVDLSCGTPTIDAPTLIEGGAVLSAIDITAGIPTIVSPIIGQVHILTASGVTARAPTIEIPRLNYFVSTTPTGGTYTISAETRIYTISAETRIYTISAETRIYTI